ncbi:MAG: 4'-phosphopantetheinyl transferase superfamily protein [archaeon]|nr:4'-phosphopantetheinyl transferase superfamily protein [archaeon]
MIKLFYSNIKDLDLNKGYLKVSSQRKSKIDNFRFEKDKKLSCGVELLLLKVLKDIGINNPIFKLDKNNKPYLSNYQNIYFNLSHSKDLIACGISDSPLGVDIEYNDPNIDLNIAKHYFFNKEYQGIINSKKPSDEFFNYWVLKESYMKYTGLGFKLELDSFEIKINKNNDTINKNTINKNTINKYTNVYYNNINLVINNQTNNNIKFNLFNLNEYGYKLAIASKYDVKEIIEVDAKDLI